MRQTNREQYGAVFPNCRRTLGKHPWDGVLAALGPDSNPEVLPDILTTIKREMDLPVFIDDLARLELTAHRIKEDLDHPLEPVTSLSVNPTLSLVPVSWRKLDALVANSAAGENPVPAEAATVHVMLWVHPVTNAFHIREATDADLLAVKVIIEEMDPKQAATMGQTKLATIQSALLRAVRQGILLAPPSKIQRDFSAIEHPVASYRDFQSAEIFTLQWHITQSCDLHCKHCYDRSDRDPMPYDKALSVLDDFFDFCRQMNVNGQVTFTGGNPLLYAHFADIYHAALDRGFGVAVLGNPTNEERMQSLFAGNKPLFFQISLEGLAEHNDYIRGPGHFKRSLAFLALLKKMNIYSMVMLTLTRDNMDQVIPLGEVLRDRADFFTFNRISTVGEARHLLMPEREAYSVFLREYEKAARTNPVLGLKDNLLNIIRSESNARVFGGCTGYGCGAAFNFVSLLPDGEVHACRKFPSLIGHIRNKSLLEIYDSDIARRYRSGSNACRTCGLNPVCRGCLAVTYSSGRDVFQEKDPYCFVTD